MKRGRVHPVFPVVLLLGFFLGCGGGAGDSPNGPPTRTWGAAALIETNDVGNAGVPWVAMDSSGNGIAVWTQWAGNRFNTCSSRYTPSGGWGAAALLETGDAANPRVAMDGSGNGIAVWMRWDGTRYNIWANRYTPSGEWGTAALIETNDAGNAYHPQVAVDNSGNAVAVWEQWDGTRYNIYFNRYTPLGGWGIPGLIETNDAGDAAYPEVAMNSSGNGIAVWRQSDGTRYNIWANRCNSSGGWGTAALIETNDAGEAFYPRVAVDSSGKGIAVWYQSDGTRKNIYFNRYTPSGGWGTAALLETNDAGDAHDPWVAMDGSGNGIAVWRQSDGTRYNIYFNCYTPSGGWGTAALLETNDAGDAADPRVAMDSSGNGIAVWKQSDGTRDNIWANQFE